MLTLLYRLVVNTCRKQKTVCLLFTLPLPTPLRVRESKYKKMPERIVLCGRWTGTHTVKNMISKSKIK